MRTATIIDDFICMPVSPRIARLFDLAQCVCTLIEGDEKALLVDTGTGYGNLRKAVEWMTDKPVEVFITHAHGDHVGGSYLWDSVYVNERELPLYLEDTAEGRAKSIASMMKQRMYSDPVGPYEVVKPREIRFVNVDEGDEFHLGGVDLKVISMPGHTPGSLGLVNLKDRYLVSGDAICRGTLIFGEEKEAMTKYVDLMKHLIEQYKGKIDYVLESHGPSPDPFSIIEGTLDACKGVLDGRYPGYVDWRFGKYLGKIKFDDAGRMGMMFRAKPESEVEGFCSDGMIGNITWFREVTE